MSVLKWSAVAVTALMALMNAGVVLGGADAAHAVTGLVQAALAVVAIVGVSRGRHWGRPAMVAVGAINVVGALIAAVGGSEGWPIGLAVSALGVVLSLVYRPGPARVATA